MAGGTAVDVRPTEVDATDPGELVPVYDGEAYSNEGLIELNRAGLASHAVETSELRCQGIRLCRRRLNSEQSATAES